MADLPASANEPVYTSVPTITQSPKGVIVWGVLLVGLVVSVWLQGDPELAIAATLVVGVIFWYIAAAFNERTEIHPDRIVMDRLVNGRTIAINNATRVTTRGSVVMVESWSGVYRLGRTESITPEMIDYIRSRAAASAAAPVWKKFPSDIAQVLTSADWDEERVVDIDDYMESLTEAEYPDFPALREFLEEFGGLTIVHGSKYTYKELTIDPNVALLNITPEIASNYIRRAGELMTPVGMFADSDTAKFVSEPDYVVLIGTSGSIYCSVDDKLYRPGENEIEGFTRIIRKVEWQEIDASGGLVPMSDEEGGDEDWSDKDGTRDEDA